MQGSPRSGSQTVALVTGGAGFIGSHLVERLVASGRRVRVTDNLSTGSERNLAHLVDNVDFLHGDLRDPDTCRAAVHGVDIVFHVAALPSIPRSLKDPWASHDANVNATMRLLLACVEAGVRRVVYSSSSSVYGNTATLPKLESGEALPRSPYAASKLAGEQYVLAFARVGRLEGVALRYFNVFGPRQDPDSPYAAVIPTFLRAAYEGCPAIVFGDGTQTRDFTYVANVVDANVLAAAAPVGVANGAVVNIGAGERTSLLRLLELVREVTGRDVGVQRRPPRPSEVRDSLAGLARAQSLIGYQPSVTLREGLKRTWDWFQAAEREKQVAVGPPSVNVAPGRGAAAVRPA
ncbi:MAG: SDR family NAD(P)-dependent oxidoreductase [Bryobacteraceae bacterium]